MLLVSRIVARFNISPRQYFIPDSIGFYNTFRFSSLRSRDFVTEEMVDILGNHCTGCKG